MDRSLTRPALITQTCFPSLYIMPFTQAMPSSARLDHPATYSTSICSWPPTLSIAITDDGPPVALNARPDLNATVPPARPGRTRVPGRSGQPAKVGGVFGRLADLQYSQGLASGSIARSMSLTDHSDRPSAVM
jgi:hypothetical protein